MTWKEAFGPQVLQPRWSGPALQFFSDADALCRHLAKHMLTHPESLAWSVAFSSLDGVVPADDRDRLWRMRQAMEQQSEPPPELVAIYRDAIRERHWTRSEWHENARTCDYALLKSKLPSPSQQIDDWLAARQRCGRMP